MSASAASTPRRFAFSPRRLRDRIGDGVLHVVTAGAALAVLAVAALIVYELFTDSKLTRDEFGFSFITSRAWDPVKGEFGALDFIYGTIYTSLVAVLVAGPAAIAIALFLTELAPRWTRSVIATLVDLLAAIPSVVIGLWGIFVLGPFVRDHLDPWLHSWFGWLPLFSGTPQQAGMLPAILILAIMIVPISASITRELFKSIPPELKEGAYGLGLTRWEMVRGVVFPYTRGGVVAAVLLGMGRAVGEAIAVTQVIGGFTGIPTSLFQPGDTLASRIAAQYQGAVSNLHIASIVYLALILLVFSLLTNFGAQVIVNRFEFQRTGGS
jgi:phosphate transport system permease protein